MVKETSVFFPNQPHPTDAPGPSSTVLAQIHSPSWEGWVTGDLTNAGTSTEELLTKGNMREAEIATVTLSYPVSLARH